MSTSLDDVDIFIFSRKIILFSCKFFQNLKIGLTLIKDFIQSPDIVLIVLYAIVLTSDLLFAFQILGDGVTRTK